MGSRDRGGEQRGKPRALLIEGCEETRDRVSESLTRTGYRVTAVAGGPHGRKELRRGGPALIVCRLEDPLGTASELFGHSAGAAQCRILMYTERGRPSEIARALQAGIEGIFEYPAELDALCDSARRLAPGIESGLSPAGLETQFIGTGRRMTRARERILALSQLRVPVLIRGELGSGRTQAAKLICRHTPAPMVVHPDRPPGRLSKHPRSYILREIDAFSPQAQGFWISALRAGSEQAGGRVVATTGADLAELVHEGRFDAELATVLSRFELRLPPLRERREDIPALSLKLCEEAAQSLGRPRVRMTRGALRELQREAWPENLRGLRLVIEQAVAFAAGGVIGVADVRTLLGQGAESVDGLRSARDRANKEALVRELRQAGGNLAEVGRQLGISRGAVIYRAQKYGLLPEPARKGRGRPQRERVSTGGERSRGR